jgi:hypothetical protein
MEGVKVLSRDLPGLVLGVGRGDAICSTKDDPLSRVLVRYSRFLFLALR